MDEEHVLEFPPGGGAIDIQLVAARGLVHRTGEVRRHVLERCVAAAPPLSIDLHYRVRRKHPSRLRLRCLDRAPRLEHAGGIDPLRDAAQILEADDPLIEVTFVLWEGGAVRTGPDLTLRVADDEAKL